MKRVATSLLILCLLTLGVAPVALGEDAPAVSSGILPIPDYTGDFWSRTHLTGDWGGTRTDWANLGITLGAWQYLWTETEAPAALNTGDGIQDLQGLGAFPIVGFGDRNTNPVSWSVAGGLSGRGLIPGRDNDTCGLGYFMNSLQEPDFILFDDLSSSTQGLEAYYNIALMGAASLRWTSSG